MRQISKPSQRHQRSTLRHVTAFTLAMALAAAAASGAQAQPAGGMGGMAGKDGMGMQHGPHHAAHHPQGGFGDMMSERMLDAVGASAEQKTRVRDILKAAQDDQRQQHEAGQALHQQMMQLMAAPTIDAAAAEALRQQQLARHDAVSKRRLQAMLDVQAVLTPEQRAKMAERMKARQDMMGRHMRERQSMPMQAPRS
jgi:Spy/CpxP family protein refolding chaperone